MSAPRPPVMRRLSRWGSRLASAEVPMTEKAPPYFLLTSVGVGAAAGGGAPAAVVGGAAGAGGAAQPARPIPASPSAAPRRTRRREGRAEFQLDDPGDWLKGLS